MPHSEPHRLPSDHVFADRRAAGRHLGRLVSDVVPDTRDVVVLGLARGGVPVAREVADAMGADLDTLVVRKIGAPGHSEFAMGAITHGGHVVINDDVPRRLGVGPDQFDDAVAHERRILDERLALYRAGREPLSVTGRVVILVDDGLATGSSMSVAIHAVRAWSASRVLVAVPTAPADATDAMRAVGADEVIVVVMPSPFHAVGQSYSDFRQVSDEEVVAALGDRPPADG